MEALFRFIFGGHQYARRRGRQQILGLFSFQETIRSGKPERHVPAAPVRLENRDNLGQGRHGLVAGGWIQAIGREVICALMKNAEDYPLILPALNLGRSCIRRPSCPLSDLLCC